MRERGQARLAQPRPLSLQADEPRTRARARPGQAASPRRLHRARPGEVILPRRLPPTGARARARARARPGKL